MSENPNTKMPKWLLYGLIAKGVLVAAITIGVVAYVRLRWERHDGRRIYRRMPMRRSAVSG